MFDKRFLFIVNCKTYERASKERALKIAEAMEELSKEYIDIAFVLIPNFLDLVKIIDRSPNLAVWAQHADSVGLGQSTGSVPVEMLASYGVKGIMLNHAEKELDGALTYTAVKKAGDLDMDSMVCFGRLDYLDQILSLNPSYLAYEIPDLIGTKQAITDLKSDDVKNVIEKYKNNSVILGSGISKASDLIKASEMGARGVLIASSVANVDDPESAIKALLSLWKQ